MLLTIDRDPFATAIAWVARALPARILAPVLGGVLIDADSAGQVRLSAYDYDVSAATTITAEVIVPDRVLVSGTLLATIAKLLPAKPVTVSMEGTDVVLTCGAARFTLPTLPAEDYPTLPALPPYLGEVNAAEFATAVRQVAPAAGTDPAAVNTVGVVIEFNRGGPLNLVASDRYRLAVRTLAWQPVADLDDLGGEAPDMVQVRVDARVLDSTARHLAVSGGTVRLSITPDGGLLGLSDGVRHTTLATFAAPFPAYRNYLPTGEVDTVTVPVAALSEAIKRAAVFSDRGVWVRLRFTATELEVSAGAHDTARGRETLPIEFDGAVWEVGFRPSYLLDALGATRTESAQLLLGGAHRSMVVFPLTVAGERDEDYQHLVMPVRIPGAPDDPTRPIAA